MSEHIFLGVAWPYANGPLHLGHVAGCYLPADIFARYHRMAGDKVLMVSGTDEHGTPITISAAKEGVAPAQIADRYHQLIAQEFEGLHIPRAALLPPRGDLPARPLRGGALSYLRRGKGSWRPMRRLRAHFRR